MYTNAQILGAVLGKFLAPLATQIGWGRISSIPSVQAIENRIRATGWVGAKWSLALEIEPFADVLSQGLVGPVMSQFLAGVPDTAIPQLAHGIIDKALDKGKLELFEGKVCLDRDDLKRLKALLDANMPISEDEGYVVKE